MKKIKILLSTALCLAITFTLTSCDNPYSDVKFDDYITIADYSAIQVAPISVSVTDAEVDAEIKSRLEAQKTTEKVTTGVVEEGNTVNIDYVGSVNGVKFEGGEEKGKDLTIGSGTFIEGFESGLLGAKVGTTVNIKVQFPANYSKAELAGKNAVFAVKINSKYQDKIPTLDEAFVKENSDVDTVEEYRALVKEELTKAKKEDAQNQQMETAWTEIVEKSEMKKDDEGNDKYPEKELKDKIDEIKTIYEDAAKKSNMSLTDFVLNNFGMDEKTFDAQVEDLAKRLVKEDLILYYIADKESIEVSRTDYKQYMQKELSKYGYTEESFKEANNGQTFEDVQGEDVIKANSLKEMVKKFIVENAKEKTS